MLTFTRKSAKAILVTAGAAGFLAFGSGIAAADTLPTEGLSDPLGAATGSLGGNGLGVPLTDGALPGQDRSTPAGLPGGGPSRTVETVAGAPASVVTEHVPTVAAVPDQVTTEAGEATGLQDTVAGTPVNSLPVDLPVRTGRQQTSHEQTQQEHDVQVGTPKVGELAGDAEGITGGLPTDSLTGPLSGVTGGLPIGGVPGAARTAQSNPAGLPSTVPVPVEGTNTGVLSGPNSIEQQLIDAMTGTLIPAELNDLRRQTGTAGLPNTLPNPLEGVETGVLNAQPPVDEQLLGTLTGGPGALRTAQSNPVSGTNITTPVHPVTGVLNDALAAAPLDNVPAGSALQPQSAPVSFPDRVPTGPNTAVANTITDTLDSVTGALGDGNLADGNLSGGNLAGGDLTDGLGRQAQAAPVSVPVQVPALPETPALTGLPQLPVSSGDAGITQSAEHEITDLLPGLPRL